MRRQTTSETKQRRKHFWYPGDPIGIERSQLWLPILLSICIMIYYGEQLNISFKSLWMIRGKRDFKVLVYRHENVDQDESCKTALVRRFIGAFVFWIICHFENLIDTCNQKTKNLVLFLAMKRGTAANKDSSRRSGKLIDSKGKLSFTSWMEA